MIKPKITLLSAPDGEVANLRSDVTHSARVHDKRATVQEHGNHAENYIGKPDVVKCPWKYESRMVNIPPSIARTMQVNVRNLCGLNGEEVEIRTCLSVQGSKLRVSITACFAALYELKWMLFRLAKNGSKLPSFRVLKPIKTHNASSHLTSLLLKSTFLQALITTCQ
jgi:hypothetical protein